MVITILGSTTIMAMVLIIGAAECGDGTTLGDMVTMQAGTTLGSILGTTHGIMATLAGTAGTTHGIMAGAVGIALGTGVARWWAM